MRKTREELAKALLQCDLTTIPMHELGPLCQAFGRPGKGSWSELVERLARALDDYGHLVDMESFNIKTWKEINNG